MTTHTHLLAALVAAHLMGDFVLQSKRAAENKTRVHVLLRHATLVAALSYLFCGAWIAWEIPAVILVTHAVIDFIKVRSKRDGVSAFAVDQLAHLVVIVVLVQRLSLGPAALYWVRRFGEDVTSALVAAAGLTVTIWVAGVVVEKVTTPFQIQLPRGGDRGFPTGGRTIGQLERTLIFVFMMTHEPGAIGFLIAAKSVLRFGELREGQRKEAEYVIIGTMWSFACGLIAALATRALLERL